MVINVAFFVCIIGLLLYALSPPTANGKVVEVGRIMFWVGLLAWLLGNTWTHRF